jgi:hypothetical protein
MGKVIVTYNNTKSVYEESQFKVGSLFYLPHSGDMAILLDKNLGTLNTAIELYFIERMKVIRVQDEWLTYVNAELMVEL